MTELWDTGSHLETRIAGEPAAIHAVADWVREQARSAGRRLAEEAVAARRVLDLGWQGEAQQAFRTAVGRAIGAADDFGGLAERAAAELDRLGTALRQAQDAMADLRAEAEAARLDVAGTTISFPGRYPLAMPDRGSVEGIVEAWDRAAFSHRVITDRWETALAEAALVVADLADALRAMRSPLLVAGYCSALNGGTLSAGDVEGVDAVGAVLFASNVAVTGTGSAMKEGYLRSTPDRAAGVRGLGFITLGVGVAVDIDAGESVTQALVSQGAGALTVAAWSSTLTPTITAGGGVVGTAAAPGVGTVVGAGGAMALSTVSAVVAGGWVNSKVDDAFEDDEPEPEPESRGPHGSGR